MLPIFIDEIRRLFKETEDVFFTNCSIAAIKLQNNPVIALHPEENNKINERIINTIKTIRKEPHISNVFYFRDFFPNSAESPDLIPRTPLTQYCSQIFPHLLNSFSKVVENFFVFLIIEFKNGTDKHLQKIEILKVSKVISTILREFVSTTKTYISTTPGNDTINLLALNHGIYSSYKLNSIKTKSIEDTPPLVAKFGNKYSVQGFVNIVRQELPTSHGVVGDINNLLKMFHFTAQSNRDYKYLREEYYVLMEYILFKKIPLDAEIILGAEKETWDATFINSTSEEIVEITQALPNKEHETRKGLLRGIHGYRNLSLELRTIQQTGMDSFPDKIIEAIDSKHNKKYTEQRTLLVVVLSEFAYYRKDVIQKWINYINDKTEIGNFKEMYLAIDANKFYRLHA